MGIEYSGATLINNGYIQCGYGGGGAGGNAANDPDKNQQDAGSSGGGGGGGAGLSIGTKGFTTTSGYYGFGRYKLFFLVEVAQLRFHHYDTREF